MSDIVISSENDNAFSAVLKAFAKATDSDVIPMSKWEVEPEDSNKSVKISAKIHVDKATVSYTHLTLPTILRV